MTGPPPECQPIHDYKWIRTDSVLMTIVMQTMPWYNWIESKSIIVREIKTNDYIQYAFAKTGFWLKYVVATNTTKLQVEIFVRTVE